MYVLLQKYGGLARNPEEAVINEATSPQEINVNRMLLGEELMLLLVLICRYIISTTANYVLQPS